MKTLISRKLASQLIAAIVASLAIGSLAFAEDAAPLAPPAGGDVSNETAPVAPMDNGGMGAAPEQQPQEAPAEAPAPKHHTKKKKNPKKSKKKSKGSKHSGNGKKKKKKKKHHYTAD